MLSPQSVNPFSLPSIPLEWKASLPSCSGIYFVINTDNKVLYIGRSVNFRNRWQNHHRYCHLKKMEGVRIAWIEISDKSLLPEIESALIDWFNPCLNSSIIPTTEIANATDRIRVSAYVSQELKAKAEKQAEKEGRSLSNYIEQLIRRDVEKGEK